MPSYDNLNPVENELLSQGIIDIEGKITEDTFYYIRTCFSLLESRKSPDVTIYFSSNGGDHEIGLMIYDIIKSYKGKTTGIVKGFCRSAALTLLQACDIRKSYKHSLLLFHNTGIEGIRYTEKDLRNSNKMLRRAKLLRKDEQIKFEVYKKNLKISRRAFYKISENDINLRPKVAKRLGIIDDIIE